MNRSIAWIAAAGLAIAAALPAMPVLAAAPAVSFSASSLDFGSAAWLKAAPTQTLVLTNTGDAALSVQSINVTGQSIIPIDFLVSSDQCSSSFNTIAPGAQCQVTVRFTPQAGGPRTATLLIFDNAAGSPQSVTLSGTGTGGVITFAPQQISFGPVAVGTTSTPMAFTVANAGDGPVAISRAAIDPAFATSGFAISHDGCASTTLGLGQRCTVSATASPTSIGLSAFAQVDVFDNAGTGVQKYNLNASGAGPLLTIVTLSQSSFNQGAGTTSAVAGFQVFASGTQPIQISSVGLDNSTAGFRIVSDTCSGATMTPAAPPATPATCEVDVVFAPTASGSFSANIVWHDNEIGGTHSQHFTGSAFAPVAVLSTSAIDFGVQADGTTSAPQVLTVTNPSPQPLSMTSAVLGGSNPSFFHLSSDTCSATTVAPGGSCSIGVVFSAPFPLQLSATLSISDSAPGSPQVVSLAGEGLGTAFSISTAHVSFGNAHGNAASAPQAITVTNTSATAMSYGHLVNGQVTVTGCTTPVNPGASCALSVSVKPNAVGPQSVRLSIPDSAGNVQFVQVDWNGTSGFASLTDGLFNLLVLRAGSSMTLTAVLRNANADVLNVGGVFLTGTPPMAITTDNCSNQAIPGGGACVITIVATPSVPGAWFTTLTVPTDAVAGPNPATLNLSGQAVAPTQPVFLPASVTFPEQQVGGPEGTQVVWLVDGLVPSIGAQVTTVSSVVLGGADPSAFRVVWDGCTGLPVGPAFSCPVLVGFDPTAGRTFNASLIFNDDAVGSPQSVPLSGSGPKPALVSIAVTPANSSVAKGLSAQYAATGTYADGTTADITNTVSWASSSTGVATIDTAGLAQAVAAGTSTISATLGSASGTTSLTVIAPMLVSVAVTPANSSVAKGLSAQFAATGTYTDATTADLTTAATWASSSTGVASIDSAGLAHAATPGTTTISATVGSVAGSTSLTVTAPTLVSIAVTPANSSVAKGLSGQLSATGTYGDGSTSDLTTTVTWASSDTTVATIDSAGKAQTVAAGTTTISATLGSVAGSTSLIVTAPTLVSIAVTPANSSLAKGLTTQFAATGTYTDASTADLTSTVIWASTSTSVAAINSAGLAQAAGVGTTTISATLGSVAGTTSLTITAPNLVSLAVTPANSSVAKGLSAQFTATGTYGDGTTSDLTTTVSWASSSGTVATINSAGLAQAASVGTTTISATLGSVAGSTSLTVIAPKLVSLALTPANSSLAKGLSAQFTATGTYTDASTADLTASSTWSSSTATVATISSSGLASAVGPGTTTITAVNGLVRGSTGLTVSAPPDKPLTITNFGLDLHHLDATAKATFKDADPNGTLAQYTATIDWGDHTTPSLAVVSKSPGGFTASGSHHYAKTGTYTVTITIRDIAGATATKSMTVKVR